MKKLVLILSMFACMFMMTACGTTANKEEASDDTSKFESTAVGLFEKLVALSDEDIENYIANGASMDEYLVEGLNSWKTNKAIVGAYKETISTKTTENDGVYTTAITAKFEKKQGSCNISISEDGNLAGVSFDYKKSTSEIMGKAGLNTLMGMGTVFAVLIFIAFAISLFGYIPKIQEMMNKKNVQQNTAVKVEEKAVEMPEEELVGDEQLVAVITAAIYASAGMTSNSKDQLVVRSIKRARR